jgi:apolipoprotein N-acyltransferase
VNSVLAETAAELIRGRRPWSGAETDETRRPQSGAGTDETLRPWGTRLGATLLLAAVCAAAGFLLLSSRDRLPVERRVRVALIQQNSDPRKHDYRRTFNTLKSLTGEALKQNPELVVWSETAFVPNIRRWSSYDPERFPLAALVQEFLDFQRGLGTWLMTGNDDYELVETKEGGQERLDYNAAILFSPAGERTATYHKIHLVPFTEYFPWKRQLPGFYRLLLTFDVYLWEPGSERVIFNHPRFRFATPICFEDAFPDDVRRFVRAGAEAIVNLSNDFWSLTEVEAQQHFANALFRAVENRRPLLRATASGVTAYVDDRGQIQAALPIYEEGQLTVDVAFRRRPPDTIYTRWGDWFPRLAGVLLALLAAAACFPGLRKRL